MIQNYEVMNGLLVSIFYPIITYNTVIKLSISEKTIKTVSTHINLPYSGKLIDVQKSFRRQLHRREAVVCTL